MGARKNGYNTKPTMATTKAAVVHIVGERNILDSLISVT
jgi:hypothetical protein